MGFLSTRLGVFAQSIAGLQVDEIEVQAYNDSVLSQMADLNTEYQLDELGVFADGTETGEYSPYTAQIKRSENKLYSHMNFDDTGETRSSITYIYDGNLRVEFNDRFELQSKYGNLFGLTSQSIEIIQPEIMENIRDFILSKL